MTLGELIGRGLDAEVYAWGTDQVVKLFYGAGRQEDARSERRAALLAYEGGTPSPAVGELVEIEGRAGIVFERAQGVTMIESMMADPEGIAPLLVELIKTQARMHTVQAPELPSRMTRTRETVQRVPLQSEALRQAVLASMTGLADGDRLLHGDFHPANVLLTASGPQVIDWSAATQGDPAADVARSCLLLRTPPTLPDLSPAEEAMIVARQALLAAAYLEGYCGATGMHKEEVYAWLPATMASRLTEGLGEKPLAWLRERLAQWATSGLAAEILS